MIDSVVLRWNANPVLVEIGPVTLHWYGLLFAVALLSGYRIMEWIYRREQKPVKALDVLFVYVMVGVIVGARLGHCLFYDPAYYMNHPLEILKIWEGGLASHGGVLGCRVPPNRGQRRPTNSGPRRRMTLFTSYATRCQPRTP